MKDRIEELADELDVDVEELRAVFEVWARWLKLSRWGPPAVPVADTSE